MDKQKIKSCWINENHGRVIGGKYDGYLLRAGLSTDPYIDILLPGGWQSLITGFYSGAKDIKSLKSELDEWLQLDE